MWNFIFSFIAALIFVGAIIAIVKANSKFRDKSKDVKPGMSEEEVMELLEKDPDSIEPLTDGTYKWIYEKMEAGSWGPTIYKTEIIFNLDKHVSKVQRSKYLERIDSKKD